MTPTPEQVSAAREWLEQRWPHNEHGDVIRKDALAALLAAREAAAYARGVEDAAKVAEGRIRYEDPKMGGGPVVIRNPEVAKVAPAIRALLPGGEK